jgi:hypothetical protein
MAKDFPYHPVDFSRLNHGSFGSPPQCVLDEVDRLRLEWLRQPDAWYFGGKLESGLVAARDAAIWLINGEGSRAIDPELVCLVENAAGATAIVARRWQKQMRDEGARALVFTFDLVYGGCRNCLHEFLDGYDVEFVTLNVLGGPWPRSAAEILSRAMEAVRSKRAELQLTHYGARPRIYGFFDHVSSQPSFKLPIAALIKEFRALFQGFQVEVCVDGAHSVGSVPRLDVVDDCGDPEFFFSNVRPHASACARHALLPHRTLLSASI